MAIDSVTVDPPGVITSRPTPPAPPRRPRRSGVRRGSRLLWRTVITLIIAAVMLYPFVWMISGSFKTVSELFRSPPTFIPQHATLENYRVVNQQTSLLGRMYLNSLIIAGSITVLQAVTCSLAAFAFARLQFRGRKVMFGLLMTSLMIPAQLTIIPNFFTMKQLHLIDSRLSLILLGAYSAFGVFLMRTYFMSIPIELHEAARVDGCGAFRSFWHVHLPLAWPIIAVNSVLAFNTAWGDFFTPLIFLKSLDNMTLPLGISLIQGTYSQTSQSVLVATLVVSILPVIVVFLIARRRLIQSVATSGIRG